MARVEVILNLLDKYRNCIKLQSVDKVTSIIVEGFQEVVIICLNITPMVRTKVMMKRGVDC